MLGWRFVGAKEDYLSLLSSLWLTRTDARAASNATATAFAI